LEKNVEWYIDKKIERTLEALRKRNMEGYLVNDEVELIDLLEKLIPPNSLVGVGDSMTLFETGVIDFLRKGNFTFLDKYREDITSEEKREIYIKNFSLGKDTPCTTLGYCIDCKSPNRICNDFVVIKGQFIKGRIKVIIVKKQLGY